MAVWKQILHKTVDKSHNLSQLMGLARTSEYVHMDIKFMGLTCTWEQLDTRLMDLEHTLEYVQLDITTAALYSLNGKFSLEILWVLLSPQGCKITEIWRALLLSPSGCKMTHFPCEVLQPTSPSWVLWLWSLMAAVGQLSNHRRANKHLD